MIALFTTGSTQALVWHGFALRQALVAQGASGKAVPHMLSLLKAADTRLCHLPKVLSARSIGRHCGCYNQVTDINGRPPPAAIKEMECYGMGPKPCRRNDLIQSHAWSRTTSVSATSTSAVRKGYREMRRRNEVKT